MAAQRCIDAAPRELFWLGGLDLAENGNIGVGTDFIEVDHQSMAGVAFIRECPRRWPRLMTTDMRTAPSREGAVADT